MRWGWIHGLGQAGKIRFRSVKSVYLGTTHPSPSCLSVLFLTLQIPTRCSFWFCLFLSPTLLPRSSIIFTSILLLDRLSCSHQFSKRNKYTIFVFPMTCLASLTLCLSCFHSLLSRNNLSFTFYLQMAYGVIKSNSRSSTFCILQTNQSCLWQKCSRFETKNYTKITRWPSVCPAASGSKLSDFYIIWLSSITWHPQDILQRYVFYFWKIKIVFNFYNKNTTISDPHMVLTWLGNN